MSSNTTDDKTEFREKLDELVGKPTGGSGKPSVAPDPVNQPMIRHWAHALDDMNPVYLDPDFAAKSRFGGIVSPPVMLQAWTMPAPKLAGIAERGGAPIEIKKNPMAFIEEAGFTGIVATNSEFEIERYPRLGDLISSTTVIRGHLRREEDRAGHRSLCHLGVHLHRPARRSAWPPAIPGLPIQGANPADQTGTDR